jgi:hypothetical protein
MKMIFKLLDKNRDGGVGFNEIKELLGEMLAILDDNYDA